MVFIIITINYGVFITYYKMSYCLLLEHWQQGPMKVYDVVEDGKYLFRVINAGAVNSLRVSVDDHVLHVISTDGYDTVPIEVESFFINPGERFDFYIEATRPVDNYYIRADTLVVG